MTKNHGTNNGATRGATGKINDAFDFESGSSNHVTITDSDSLDLTGDDFSFNYWAKVETNKNL
jgi:hypothetical protein